MTTQELMQRSHDLRERRLHKCAALVKQAADNGATDDRPATTTPTTPPAAAPAPQSKTFEFLGRIPPEAWGAILGLGTGTGIGAAIGGKKGALYGAGIGAGVGAGAGYGYKKRDAIGKWMGDTFSSAKKTGADWLAQGKEAVGKGKEAFLQWWNSAGEEAQKAWADTKEGAAYLKQQGITLGKAVAGKSGQPG